jgi:hypothetical protein
MSAMSSMTLSFVAIGASGEKGGEAFIASYGL